MRDDKELLVWERVDGELDAAQGRVLERLRAEDPEIRTLLEDAEELNRLLAKVEEVEPPPALRREVERRIAAEPVAEPRARSGLTGGRALWMPRLAFLTAGVLLGALAVQLLGGRMPEGAEEVSPYYGAVAPRPSESVVSVPVPQLPGRLQLSTRGSHLVADIELGGEQPVEIVLRSSSGMKVSSLESGTVQVDLELATGSLVLRAAGPGTCVLSVELADPAVPVAVSIELAGRIVAEETSRPSASRRRGADGEP